MAATNRPWELDEAILRRLPRAFEVGMPDRKQRGSILKVILKDENVESCLDIDQLAGRTEGYSGSDLTELCKQAAYMPIRDLLDEEKDSEFGTAKVKQNSTDLIHWFCCCKDFYIQFGSIHLSL